MSRPSYSSTRRRLAAGILAVVLVGPACTDRGDDGAASDRTPPSGERSEPESALSYETLAAQGALAFVKHDDTTALEEFRKARALRPDDPAAALNVAIAAHAAGDYAVAIEAAADALEAIGQDESGRVRASALYVSGCARLRREEWAEAERSFAGAAAAAPAEPAVYYQLGWARFLSDDPEGAVAAFRETVALDPLHPSAHYMLSQAFARLGRPAEAGAAAARHQEALRAHPGGSGSTREALEPCRLMEPIVPPPEEPDAESIPVRFVTATPDVVDDAGAYGEPMCYLDMDLDDDMDLFARAGGSIRVLRNDDGHLAPVGDALALGTGRFRRALAGRLITGKATQVVVVGENGSRLFTVPPDGVPVDLTASSGLADVGARDAVLANIDHTGALDLLLATGDGVRFMRNAGTGRFADETTALELPSDISGVEGIATGDVDGDDLLDLVAVRDGRPGVFFANAREGRLGEKELTPGVPAGTHVAAEDLDGDFALDLVVASEEEIVCRFGAGKLVVITEEGGGVEGIALFDYDNDGWLDVLSVGNHVRVYRNRGRRGFLDVTSVLGLDGTGPVAAAVPMDVDSDGDTDLVLARPSGGIEILRNEGGDANASVRLALTRTSDGNSVYGTRVELFASGFRAARTVHRLPLDVGLGRHGRVGVMNVVWPDQIQQVDEIDAREKGEPLAVTRIAERYTQAGSCPYMYAWDGEHFRFVTDVLGGAPLGLPLAPGLMTPADVDEMAWIGDASHVPPREGAYEIRVTEELREVLYVDEATLVVVDHPMGTEVHPTDKLRMPPFPPSDIVTVSGRVPLLAAATSAGVDVTDAVREIDGQQASPPSVLGDHLRGRAVPHGYVLDFGPLDAGEPWVLALTGWLRYGGASGNVAASRDPELSNPFPTLEAETGSGWHPVDVVVGLPAGKTKTILVDLEGAIPEGTRRLRLSLAAEAHWDRIALFRRAASQAARTRLSPMRAELRAHGYGCIEPHAWNEPVTNSYEQLSPAPPWRWTPEGFYTRYGDVTDLVSRTDDRLAVLGGGDEVALAFDASVLPPVAEGFTRELFLYSVGWDKDADYNCVHGLTVGPLPFHDMDDQRYGIEQRPLDRPDAWIGETLTRWIPAAVPETRLETTVDAFRAYAAGIDAWRSPIAPSPRTP